MVPAKPTALLLALLLACSAVPLRADRIVLKDGRTINGTMTRKDDKLVITPAGGGMSITIEPNQLQEIKLTGDAIPPAQLAESQWVALQSQLAKTDDLTAIVALHEKFIQSHPTSPEVAPVLAKAQASLDQYRTYANGHFVRFAGKWVAADERDRLVATAQERANASLQAFKDGDLKTSLSLAGDALKSDPTNPTALTVAGCTEMRQTNHWVAAKGYFERLAEAQPNNALAWNNLAVIAGLQKRAPEGLKDYTKALQSGANNRELLDNIAEALHAFDGPKTNAVYADLVRQYAQADVKMSAKLATMGWYRYGGSWITQEQKDRLAANRQGILNRMQALQGQYDQLQDSIAAVQRQIVQAQNDANTISVQISTLDVQIQTAVEGVNTTSWVLQRNLLATQYNDAVARIDRLTVQKNSMVVTIKPMQEEAKRLQQSLDTAVFTGVQRVMEPGDLENPPPAPRRGHSTGRGATAPASPRGQRVKRATAVKTQWREGNDLNELVVPDDARSGLAMQGLRPERPQASNSRPSPTSPPASPGTAPGPASLPPAPRSP